jgi:hypothetical protein
MKMCKGRKEKTLNFVTHPAQNFGSLLSVSFHPCSTLTFIYMQLIPKGPMDEANKPIKSNVLSENGEQ